MASLVGRRKFLALGGAGAAVLIGTAGVAKALITAGGDTASPRSLPPVGLNSATGRSGDAIGAPPLGVKHFALAGTDGWVSMPWSGALGTGMGAASIDPYFPDPLADPANTTTYAFCFRNVTGLDRSQVAAQKGHTQICAPIFYSTVGEEIWVTLTNLGLQLRPDLIDGHTLHWHGFRNAIPFYDGVPESSIAVAIGHDFTYVYRPKDAGTYMYHCHFEDVEHVTMGMHGIVFVKPNPADVLGLASGQQKAYGQADGDATGETKFDREYAIMLSEIDTRAHFGDAHIQATDWTDFHADMWTMNGRAYPDTVQPNGVRDETGQLFAQTDGGLVADTVHGGMKSNLQPVDPASDASRLFSNPLSSVVQASPGDRILIRFANLGFLDHTIVFPGLEVDVLGRDSRYVPPNAQRKATDSIQIGPGESRDVFFTAPAEGTYPFYDRGMSHYAGSEDGTNAWVGGQRSEVRVLPNLAPQLKPNGWAGEPEWAGEFPVAD
jgi:FtsP/CotA-like multicopper oxidase with cupredoxin domain